MLFVLSLRFHLAQCVMCLMKYPLWWIDRFGLSCILSVDGLSCFSFTLSFLLSFSLFNRVEFRRRRIYFRFYNSFYCHLFIYHSALCPALSFALSLLKWQAHCTDATCSTKNGPELGERSAKKLLMRFEREDTHTQADNGMQADEKDQIEWSSN